MELTPEEYNQLPERLRTALRVGPQTLTRPSPRTPPEGKWLVRADDGVQKLPTHITRLTTPNGTVRATRELAERFAADRLLFSRQHAYRDEFAPDYVVPPLGHRAYFVATDGNGAYAPCDRDVRRPGAVYMPEHVAKQLADDINSGRFEL